MKASKRLRVSLRTTFAAQVCHEWRVKWHECKQNELTQSILLVLNDILSSIMSSRFHEKPKKTSLERHPSKGHVFWKEQRRDPLNERKSRFVNDCHSPSSFPYSVSRFILDIFMARRWGRWKWWRKKPPTTNCILSSSLRCCRRNVLTRVLFSSLSSSFDPSADDGSSHFLPKQQNAIPENGMTKDTRLTGHGMGLQRKETKAWQSRWTPDAWLDLRKKEALHTKTGLGNQVSPSGRNTTINGFKTNQGFFYSIQCYQFVPTAVIKGYTHTFNVNKSTQMIRMKREWISIVMEKSES